MIGNSNKFNSEQLMEMWNSVIRTTDYVDKKWIGLRVYCDGGWHVYVSDKLGDDSIWAPNFYTKPEKMTRFPDLETLKYDDFKRVILDENKKYYNRTTRIS